MPNPVTQAVILCGGKGTRLGTVAARIPKPMVEVDGMPLLDRTLELLFQHGIRTAWLLAGHLAEVIEQHYALPRPGMPQVRIAIEPQPMGTAGGLWQIAGELETNFLLVYGDIFLDFDVGALIAAHAADLDQPLATLTVRASDHPWDSDLVEKEAGGRVTAFIHRQDPAKSYVNLANAAIYVCNRDLLNFIPRDVPSDFGAHVFPAALAQNQALKTWTLPVGQFVRDMGTPARLQSVENYLMRKQSAAKALKQPKPVRTVFLDRDGTLNVERGLITRPEQLDLMPHAGAAVARLNAANIACHVVTNQPVIARGLCDEGTLGEIHQRLRDQLAQHQAKLGHIRYCPHHPETHHAEGIKELRRACDCRKPAPGLLVGLMDAEHIDAAEAVMIGDRECDVLAGKQAGTRTILLSKTVVSSCADVILPDLAAAVDHLLHHWTTTS